MKGCVELSYKNKKQDEKYLCNAKITRQESGNYLAEFPGFEGCMAFGKNIEDTLESAENACAGWLLTKKGHEPKLFVPNKNGVIGNAPDVNEFNILINVNITEYKKRISNQSVKKNLTIPQWLHDLAEKDGNVNYSSLLQEALKEYLGK